MADDRYIVNGAHQTDRLRELLDVFIDKFVLCASCKNPETELRITGKGRHEDMKRDCKACGAHTDIDMRHKLVTFILKNPPKKPTKGSKGKKGMTAEANVGGPMVFDAATPTASGNGNGNDEEDGEDEDESPPGGSPVVPTSGTEIDAMLGKADPLLEDPEEVLAKVKNLDLGNDDEDEDDADSPYAQLGYWLEENQGVEDAEIIGKVKELEIVGKHKVLLEIGEKLFTDSGVVKEVDARVRLLQVVSQT